MKPITTQTNANQFLQALPESVQANIRGGESGTNTCTCKKEPKLREKNPYL